MYPLRYKDTSTIIDIYTEISRRASFLVPVSRPRKAAVKLVLFQPLFLVELETDFCPNTTIYKVKGVRPFYSFTSILYGPYRSAVALFLPEFLRRVSCRETESRPLFAYLQHSIVWLNGCGNGFANLHLVFSMRLPCFLGLYPNLEDYHNGNCSDLQNACSTPLRPQLHSDFMGLEEASRLTMLIHMNYETMHLFDMNRTERAYRPMIIDKYYCLHLPDFPVLKSLEVLKELSG